MRNFEPKNNFLKKVRSLCDRNGIILIFDECTSGFRETFGGLHLKYGINPDIAMFGKSLGNGYAINAIIGKNEVMNMAFKAHKAIGCRSITRSDFKFFNDKFYLLEINTQPGMTKLSLVPEIADFNGISFKELIEWILKDASKKR